MRQLWAICMSFSYFLMSTQIHNWSSPRLSTTVASTICGDPVELAEVSKSTQSCWYQYAASLTSLLLVSPLDSKQLAASLGVQPRSLCDVVPRSCCPVRTHNTCAKYNKGALDVTFVTFVSLILDWSCLIVPAQHGVRNCPWAWEEPCESRV